MTSERIDAYASALLGVARAEGRLDEVEDELFRFGRSLEASESLRATLTDEMIPPAKRQAVVEDLLGGKASSTTTQLLSFVIGSGRAADLPEHHHRARRSCRGDEVPHRRRGPFRSRADRRPERPVDRGAGQRHRQASRAEGRRRPLRARRSRRSSWRHRHRRQRSLPSRSTEDASLKHDVSEPPPPYLASERITMAELTISPGDIAAAIKKNLDGFEPTLEARTIGRIVEVGDGIARVSGLPGAGVNEMLEFADGSIGIALNLDEAHDRCRHLGRERQARRRSAGQSDRSDLVGARRRRRARPRRQRARRADRWQGSVDQRPVAPDGDPGAWDHGAQAGARAVADRHQSDRRDDPDRPRPTRADHR